MANITYKTVIASAIADFNSVQDAIYNKQTEYEGARNVTLASVTSVSGGIAPTASLNSQITNYLQWKANGTLTATGVGSNINVKYYEYVSIPAAVRESNYITTTVTSYQAITTAGWTGTNAYIIAGELADPTISITTAASAKATVTTNMATIASTTGLTNGTDYWTISPAIAVSSAQIKTNAEVTSPGWIPTTNKSKTSTIAIASSVGASLYIPKATFKASGSGVYVSTAGYIPALTDPLSTVANISYNTAYASTANTTPYTTGNIVSNAGYATAGYIRTGAIGTGESAKAWVTPSATINNANGMATLGTASGTAGEAYFRVTATGNITASGAGAAWYSASSGWVGNKASTGITVGVKTSGTAGSSGITIPRAFFSTASQSLSYTNYVYTDYSTSTANFTIGAGGTLYIKAGYIPSTAITLGQLISDIDNEHDLTAPLALTGFKFYNDNGELVTGTMGYITPTTTYYTTTSTAGVGEFGGTSAAPVALSAKYYVKTGAYSGTYITSTATGNYKAVTTSGWLSDNLYVKAATPNTTYLSTTNTGYAAVTAAGWLPATYYIKSGTMTAQGGAITATSNSTAANALGSAAIMYSTSTNLSSYVTVSFNRGAVTLATATSGWVSTVGGLPGAANATGYIPALATTTAYVTVTGNNSVNSPTVGAVTTFNSSTGTKTAGTKTAQTTATITVGASSGTLASNTYYVKAIKYGISEAVTKTSTGTATIASVATGSDVDNYVEALYKRMLGVAYTAVDPD